MRGLFIDLDGTLADSLGTLREVYDRFLAQFDRTPTGLEFDRLNGLTLFEIVGVLQKVHGLPGTAENLLEIYDGLIDEAYEQVEPSPGALELIRQAQALDWMVMVVTANTQARSRRWLERCGLMPHIARVVSAEQAARGKPWPDLYLVALEKSGCGCAESFAVEDSPKGVQSARLAGLSTFHYVPAGRKNELALDKDVVQNLGDLIVHLK